jgi:Tol biopolymer transport system component
MAQVATAQAIVQGAPTQLPPNAWTATPTPPTPAPTATPMLLAFDQLTATPTATSTPTAVPDVLRGKILFYSDRFGAPTLMVMNPDGSDVAVWAADAGEWLYQRTKSGADIAPDGRFRVIVSDHQLDMFPDHKLGYEELFVVPLVEPGKPEPLTRRDELKAMSYDAVWSPVDYKIAFVSAGPGNDEIFTIRPDGSELTRLTTNQWEWDKHPSWSPDGSQIVFWSNRETQRKQIWIMNADGSGQRNVSNNEYNDWDPVWVK